MNKKFGNLTYIKDAEPRLRKDGKGVRRRSVFQCSCGNLEIRDHSDVKNGHNKGCKKCVNTATSERLRTHELIKHPLYMTWVNLKNRCYNPKVNRYVSYGARGIKVCDLWQKDFKAFYDFCIEKGWVKGLTIDRIDVHGDYCPENCRVLPQKEQHYNKQNTFYVEYYGEKVCLLQLLRANNIDFKTYRSIKGKITRGTVPFQHFIDLYDLKPLK